MLFLPLSLWWSCPLLSPLPETYLYAGSFHLLFLQQDRAFCEPQCLLEETIGILPWQANIKHPDGCSFKDMIQWASTKDEIPPCLPLVMPYFRLLACITAGQSVLVLIHYFHLWISDWYFLGVIRLANTYIYICQMHFFWYLKTAFHHIL